MEEVQNGAKKIESTALRGSQKVWIWDSYLMSKIAWVLLVHDIAPSFVNDVIQPIQNRCFWDWLGYTEKGNLSNFYRSRQHHGL